MGSGHSDIACTADVVKFPDVGPNQTVKVNAPVQTLLNVLYTKDTPGLNPPAPWPPNWASFVPTTRVVRLYGDYYGGVCPALLGSDISPSPASIANINTAAIKNSVVGGYTLVSKGTTRPVQGRNGPGILFEHTASNKPTLELKAAAHNYGKPPTVYDAAIAGVFKYLSGAPIIMSSSHPEASSSALRRMYVQYINATTLRLYLCKRSWSTQVETYADYTVPDGWNYIALERVDVIGSLDVSAVASLRINDTILVGDRFAALLDAELDKKKENLVVTAVHELDPVDDVLRLDDEEREMVDAEISDLAEWLGVPVVRAR